VTQIAEILSANRGYAMAQDRIADPKPSRHLAIVTCMDARIDVFAALGLRLGEAHVIRNAGGRVTDDVLRSLAVSSSVLDVDTVVVLQHTKCGLAGVSNEELRRATGADLDFRAFNDHAAALDADLRLLTGTSYLSSVKTIYGLVYDVDTRAIESVVHEERPSPG
jgi:carbonic anhydrase